MAFFLHIKIYYRPYQKKLISYSLKISFLLQCYINICYEFVIFVFFFFFPDILLKTYKCQQNRSDCASQNSKHGAIEILQLPIPNLAPYPCKRKAHRNMGLFRYLEVLISLQQIYSKSLYCSMAYLWTIGTLLSQQGESMTL